MWALVSIVLASRWVSSIDVNSHVPLWASSRFQFMPPTSASVISVLPRSCCCNRIYIAVFLLYFNALFSVYAASWNTCQVWPVCHFLKGWNVCRLQYYLGRDSVVGIASRYGLEGSGFETRWWRDFTHPPSPTLGPTQLPVQWVLGATSRG
jgi:hypothetical protein